MSSSVSTPISFDDYSQRDAVGLAEWVRNKEVSPEELLETAIARAEAVNPRLNAIIQPLYDKGREMLRHLPANAPFRGVPFLLKDLSLEWAGTPLRNGCRGYQNNISSLDSDLVKKYRAAGLVFFGKTNTPEFGLVPYTEPTLFGPTYNPWNRAYSPGGSSGGSAAAIAAGIVPAASGSDGGGSIRIPASCCGLFGMKPSRGRTPLGPQLGELWSGAAVENTLTRSVRDSAALLDAIQGETAGAPYIIEPPKRPYREEVTTEPGRLRIAYCTQHLYPHLSVHEECKKAIANAVQVLQRLGHDVEEVSIPYTWQLLRDTFLTLILGETASALNELSVYLGRPVRRSDVERNTWLLAKMGDVYTAGDYAYSKRYWNELSRKMAALHRTYDVFVTPTLAQPPIRIGAMQNTPLENRLADLADLIHAYRFVKGSKLIDMQSQKSFSYSTYTPVANITGQPSMSVPLHWTADNLPVGVMFTGRFGEEDVLYRLAGQLEREQPWFNKRPVIT